MTLRTLYERALVHIIKILPFKRWPKTRLGDYFSALHDFTIAHDRLPSRRRTFNDPLFRLTTSDECLNPLRVFVTDKEYLKLFVRAKVGEKFNIPTLAILRSELDVREFSYPKRCVIKPTHLSGQVILRRAGEKLNVGRIVGWLDTNWYLRPGGWEANYRYLAPKVIIEPFVFDDDSAWDYKVFCMKGNPKMIEVDVGRHTSDQRRAFYTPSWDHLPFSATFPMLQRKLKRPRNLDQMLNICRRISDDFSFIRVDLYSNGEQVYIGELTNCPAGALAKFEPRNAEDAAGRIVFGGE